MLFLNVKAQSSHGSFELSRVDETSPVSVKEVEGFSELLYVLLGQGSTTPPGRGRSHRLGRGSGSEHLEISFLMPVCPDCSVWTFDFTLGATDPWGTWFCNDCWDRFDETEKQDRLKSGNLLPEDRILWYSDSVKPTKLYEADKDINYHVSNHSNQKADDAWLSVDNYSLIVEFHHDSDSNRRSDEGLVKSMPWRHTMPDEVFFSFDGGYITIGESVPTCSIADLPEVWSQQLLISDRAERHREKAKLTRKARLQQTAFEQKQNEEKEEQKRKQQVQVEAKKKELVELAVKRAQQKTKVKKPLIDRLTLLKKRVETWKSQTTVSDPIKLAPAKAIRPVGEEPPLPETSAKRRRVEPSPPPSSARIAAKSVAEEARRIARLGMPLRPPTDSREPRNFRR